MENTSPNSLKEIIPAPVYYGRIYFEHPGEEGIVDYTDCWEISVYRFLHLIFAKEGVIDFERLGHFMEPEKFQCKLLISFFEKYPVVKTKEDYYQTQEGLKERAEWAKMLNSCKCLYLKRKNKTEIVQIGEGGQYEVAATIENTFDFFANFFPKLTFMRGESNEIKL